MRRELVERRGWLTHREFLEDWALSKLSLGINQIALTGLEGLRVAGVPGVAVAVAALLLPSGAITALMTAGYSAVRDEAVVRAALAGAGPVTAGMTIGISYTFAQGAIRRGWRGVVDRAYWVGVVAIGLFAGISPIVVILAGAVIGLAFLRGETTRAAADPGT
jgi:chromate transporter